MTKSRLTWRKTDSSISLENCADHEAIGLYYLRLYTAGKTYSHSETNQLIFNLKKPLNRPKSQLDYKSKAIKQFAEELSDAFVDRKSEAALYLVPDPTSKCSADPEHDDRLVKVVTEVCGAHPNLIKFPVLIRTQSIAAKNQTPGKRTIEEAARYLAIDENVAKTYGAHGSFLVVDDVLLSGSTFAANRNALLQRFPGTSVYGVFWAHSQRNE